MNQPRAVGRPKDPEKREAILLAAARLFLEQGFERTTVDAIATQAGVSKLTVYSHFDGKEGLFQALIVDKCAEHFGAPDFTALAPRGPRAALTHIALAFLPLMFHPDVIALHRILATGRDAQMNRTFWETGPRRLLADLAALLARFHAERELDVPDPALAADQFFALLKGADHLRAILAVGELPPPHALQDYGEAAVDTFLRAYAPR
ncbi:MAG: TetR/AcrR family transcriptional regulator [Gammaproteobacteria bacterium]